MLRQYLRTAYHKIGTAVSSAAEAVVATLYTYNTFADSADNIQTPDSVLNSALDDGTAFTCIWKCTVDDITGGGRQVAISKYVFATADRTYATGFHEDDGKMFCLNSADGTVTATAKAYRVQQDPGQTATWFKTVLRRDSSCQSYQACTHGLPGAWDWSKNLAISGTIKTSNYDGIAPIMIGGIGDGSSSDFFGDMYYAAQYQGMQDISDDSLVPTAVWDARDYSDATTYANTGSETDWTSSGTPQGGELAVTSSPAGDSLAVLMRAASPKGFYKHQGQSEIASGGGGMRNENVNVANGQHVSVAFTDSIISGNTYPGQSVDYAGGSAYSVATSVGITDYPLTMCCFMQINGGATTDHYLMTTADASNATQRMWVGYGSDGIAKIGKGNASTAYTAVGTTNLTNNSVHHVAAVFEDATTATLYVNGVAEATLADSVTGHTWDNWYIARNYSSGNQYLGVMAYMGYYDSALSAETLKAFYDARSIEEYNIPAFDYLRMDNLTDHKGARAEDYAEEKVTGEIDVQVFVALDDWTPTSQQALFNAWETTGDDRCWLLSVKTTGELSLHVNSLGTNADTEVLVSTTAPSLTNTTGYWLRATWTPSSVVTFYTGGTDKDTPSWSQLGSTVATTKSSLYGSSVSDLTIGGYDQGDVWKPVGKFYKAILKSGIDGTVVANFDVTPDMTGLNGEGWGSFRYYNSAKESQYWRTSFNDFNPCMQAGFD